MRMSYNSPLRRTIAIKISATSSQTHFCGSSTRIYGLNFGPEAIACGGCLGPDEAVFCTSRKCSARRCCRSRGLASCAECADRPCADLERAQSIWDGLEEKAKTLPESAFREFVLPYCHARQPVPG